MNYKLLISETAQKSLVSIPVKNRRMIEKKIEGLIENPRPNGYEALEGSPGFFRIRSGDYRVIYTIEDDVLIVTVICIGLRDKIYKMFKRLIK